MYVLVTSVITRFKSNRHNISFVIKIFKMKLVLLLATVLLTQSMHLHNNHEASVDLPAGTVRLMADNGQYLKKCTNCGEGAYPDSASISAL